MVSFKYKRMGIRIREMAFGTINDIWQEGCDVVYMHSNESEYNAELIRNRAVAREQYTLENDLTNAEGDIFNGFNKNYTTLQLLDLCDLS